MQKTHFSGRSTQAPIRTAHRPKLLTRQLGNYKTEQEHIIGRDIMKMRMFLNQKAPSIMCSMSTNCQTSDKSCNGTICNKQLLNSFSVKTEASPGRQPVDSVVLRPSNDKPESQNARPLFSKWQQKIKNKQLSGKPHAEPQNAVTKDHESVAQQQEKNSQ